MRKIKRDDDVIVLTGRDKGKRGKVNKVLSDGKLIVSGIQMVKKHQSLILKRASLAELSKRSIDPSF